MKTVYLAMRAVDLGYEVLSAWESHKEAQAEIKRVFHIDLAKNKHTEINDYVVKPVEIGAQKK